eukprot:350413-Chlamydomonas_euryale.AAC.2
MSPERPSPNALHQPAEQAPQPAPLQQQQPSPPRAPHQCDLLPSEGRRQQWEDQQVRFLEAMR